MADKRTIELLTAIEKEMNAVSSRVYNVHDLVRLLHEKIDQMKQADDWYKGGSNAVEPYRDEISAEFYIGGLSGTMTRAFWEKHRDKAKLFLFTSLSMAGGWVAKIIHMYMSK